MLEPGDIISWPLFLTFYSTFRDYVNPCLYVTDLFVYCTLQVTLAQLKDKPSAATTPTSSSLGVSSGVRSAAARFLGTGNGSRALSFVGGNGGSKSVSGANRAGLYSASTSNNLPSNSNFDAKGTYLIFNVGDTVFISDLNSQDKVLHLSSILCIYPCSDVENGS